MRFEDIVRAFYGDCRDQFPEDLMNTAAYAHAPKLRNMSTRNPFESGGDVAYRTGMGK